MSELDLILEKTDFYVENCLIIDQKPVDDLFILRSIKAMEEFYENGCKSPERLYLEKLSNKELNFMKMLYDYGQGHLKEENINIDYLLESNEINRNFEINKIIEDKSFATYYVKGKENIFSN